MPTASWDHPRFKSGRRKNGSNNTICANSPLAIRIRLNEKEIIHAEGNVIRCTLLKEPIKIPNRNFRIMPLPYASDVYRA